jgi:hypothetical protein
LDDIVPAAEDVVTREYQDDEHDQTAQHERARDQQGESRSDDPPT